MSGGPSREEAREILEAEHEERLRGYLGADPPPPNDESYRATVEEFEVHRDLVGEVPILRKKDEPEWMRNQSVAKAVFEACEKIGTFYQTQEARLYWYREMDHRLYDAEERGVRGTGGFALVLSIISGINPEDPVMRFILGYFRVQGPQKATEAEVHYLSHWDPDDEVLYIDRFDGTLYLLDGKSIKTAPNGTNGVLFLPVPNAEPVDFQEADANILEEKVLSLLCVREMDDYITEAEGRELLADYLVAMFFRSIQPTRPIACFWGEKGTGKTTVTRAIGQLLFGPRFDVTAIARQKEDAFQAKVTHTAYAAFDNADGRIPWLADALAVAATGGFIERRRLYTTNDLASYPIQAWISITSRDPRYGRDDIGERLLIFPTRRPTVFRSEAEIQRDILQNRGRLWGDLLERLQRAIRRLKANTDPYRGTFRMADFASLLMRLQADDRGRDRVKAILKKQTALQDFFISERATAMWLYYLAEIVADRAMAGVAAGEIVKSIQAWAKADSVPTKVSPVTVGRVLTNAGPNLRALGLKVSHRVLRGRTLYTISSGGEDGSESPPSPPRQRKLTEPSVSMEDGGGRSERPSSAEDRPVISPLQEANDVGADGGVAERPDHISTTQSTTDPDSGGVEMVDLPGDKFSADMTTIPLGGLLAGTASGQCRACGRNFNSMKKAISDSGRPILFCERCWTSPRFRFILNGEVVNRKEVDEGG